MQQTWYWANEKLAATQFVEDGMQTWKQKIDGGKNIEITHSRPNESTQDVELPTPQVVRVVRTIRVEMPPTSTSRTDTSTRQSKRSSRQTAAFFIDHPILAMLALSLIALIGFICILVLPIR